MQDSSLQQVRFSIQETMCEAEHVDIILSSCRITRPPNCQTTRPSDLMMSSFQ